MSAPEKIVDLVTRFDNNLEAYRSGKYNEAALRQEYLNPLFIELGWDVYNEHVELDDLNNEAVQLAATIQKNFQELGI